MSVSWASASNIWKCSPLRFRYSGTSANAREALESIWCISAIFTRKSCIFLRTWFTDETQFHPHGHVTKQNIRIWATESPNSNRTAIIPRNALLWYTVAGIAFVGLIFLSVVSDRYRDVLSPVPPRHGCSVRGVVLPRWHSIAYREAAFGWC